MILKIKYMSMTLALGISEGKCSESDHEVNGYGISGADCSDSEGVTTHSSGAKGGSSEGGSSGRGSERQIRKLENLLEVSCSIAEI